MPGASPTVSRLSKMATTVAAMEPAQSENFSDSPLTKMLMLSEKSAEESKDFSWKERLFRFMVIAGSRYALVTLSVLIHVLIFLFGLMHYDNRIDGPKTLKKTSVARLIADASTLVLHFDLAIVLLPLCRTLISVLGGTSPHNFIRIDYAVRLFEHVTSQLIHILGQQALSPGVVSARVLLHN